MFVTIVKLPSNETNTTKSDTVKFQDAESKLNKQKVKAKILTKG